MNSLIECPVCEETFPLAAQQRNQPITCPGCNRSFQLAESVPLAKEEVKLPTVSLTRQRKPELASIEKSSRPKKIAAKQRTQQSVSAKTERDQLGVDIRPDLYPRQRKKFDSIFVGIFCLVTVFGVAMGLFYLEGRRTAGLKDSEDAAMDAVLPQHEKIAAVTTVDPATSDVPKSETIPSLAVPATEAIKEQSLRFFSKKQLKKNWSEVQPHLVSLEIENQYGKRPATGTIIDSRGWVVTSYQAIKDAWRIQVTASDKSLEAAQESPPLEDLVQGIVATDPENNLAILAVNRRFVVSLAEVNIVKKNSIVKGEYLVQAGPPTKLNPFGNTEVKISARGNVDGLEKKAQLRAESFGLSQPDQVWLTYESPIASNAGMPLFGVDGTLTALTVFRDGKTSYALSADHVKRLIDSTDGTITRIRAPVVVSSDGETVTRSDDEVDNVAKRLIIDLNQAGQQCEPFQFLPTDDEEYSLLQEFARSNAAAFEYVTEYDGEMDSILVQMQLEQWEKKLAANLQQIFNANPDRLIDLNEFASKEIKRGDRNHVVFFGSVYVGGIQSGKLILKFYDRELYVSAPFDPAARPMLPGSHWLIFAETPARARRLGISIPGDQIIPTETALIHYVIGPIEE